MLVKEAAGWTREEVPQTRKTSQCLAASRAESQVRSGRDSPNQTTPGRILAPHAAQRGGSMRAPPSGTSGMPSG